MTRAIRNVVTLSTLPLELHEWLRDEAARRTQQEGKPVHIYSLVVAALEEFRQREEQKGVADADRRS